MLKTKLELMWFDLTQGTPLAVRELFAALGAWKGTVALLHFARRNLTSRPFAALSSGPLSPGEHFTRHQLRPVLLLDEVLRQDLALPDEQVQALLGRIVSHSGARFIATQLRLPDADTMAAMSPGERRSVAERILSRFLNAEAEVAEVEGFDAAFNVSACHFAAMTRELGRPELAPLFCRADSVYFSRDDAPLRLTRDTTLANGGDHCAFRFHLNQARRRRADQDAA